MHTSDIILISDSEEPLSSTQNEILENQKRLHKTGPKSLKEACAQTPYCLYVDMGLELDKNTCAVFIGYFDQVSGASVVKKLGNLSLNQENFRSVIIKHNADAAADVLISMLNKYELNLGNLKVFYCNVPDPEVNRMVEMKLKELNPHLVSLGGLACMAGGACQIGLLECFSHVIDLINDIHYFTLPIFLPKTNYNFMLPIALQYSAIITIIQQISVNWKELTVYFKNQNQDIGASRLLRIVEQLHNPIIRLDFQFLSHALDPFRSLQDLQSNKTCDIIAELQMTSMLISAHAASIFQPTATEQFLKKKDLQMLFSEKDLLPVSSVNVGFQAKKSLSTLSFAVLGDQERSNFLLNAVLLYQKTLKVLLESLPGHLSPLTMRNVGTLLKHPYNLVSKKLTSAQLIELASQLGVCKTDSSVSQLASEYVNYIQKETIVRRNWFSRDQGLCWVKVLESLAPFPVLYELVMTLLAFPRSLQMKDIIKGNDVAPNVPILKNVRKRIYVQRPERTEASSSDEDRPKNKPSRPTLTVAPTPKQEHNSEDSEYTDNSSDVVDVTEEFRLTSKLEDQIIKGSNNILRKPKQPESVYILDSENDECNLTTVKPTLTVTLTNTATTATPEALAQRQQGELVLICLEDSLSWPAVTVPSLEDDQEPDMKMVQWYGHGMTSEVCIEYLKPFANFARFFCPNTFATNATYKDAVFLSLREASARCQKQFSASFDDKEEILGEMLLWAFSGYKPTGPKGFQPAVLDKMKISNTKTSASKVRPEDLRAVSVSLCRLSVEMPDKSGGSDSSQRGVKKKSTSGWKGKGPRKKSNLFSTYFDDDKDDSPDFVPYKKRAYTKPDLANKTSTVYTQPDQKIRASIIRRIMEIHLDIEAYCLCCGIEDIVIFHPLFKGSLCLECKNNFTETLYRYDEDGYQSYCTICCYGMEVVLCGNDSCCRSFCADCLNILVCDGTFDSLKDLDPWICYLCQPHQTHGALTPREDWSIRVQELFANNSAIEFEPHRVYPSIAASLRHPVRVLSLFDGISTGYLVLKELGFKVEKYVASEVCEDSIAVSTVNHDGKIIHVGDVKRITQEHLNKWGPFDLLIGGSPCNDLSIVNPIRKGLYEGTGRLFFDFHRILHLLKPKEEDPRPFFWLFENVVFMNVHDRLNICRFLECNPVLVDAVKVSPANRARYFWGNIPGMSRPIAVSQMDKLNLQDCLEIGRVARVTKVRTITTNSNSLKQGKDVSLLPVLQNGTGDTLWITEIEKIFGFPKHYTDVRNMNRQQRQKVLGKAWSVPVIRHLFAPLKDYFACEELAPLTTTATAFTSSSSPSPLSPATPELHHLR